MAARTNSRSTLPCPLPSLWAGRSAAPSSRPSADDSPSFKVGKEPGARNGESNTSQPNEMQSGKFNRDSLGRSPIGNLVFFVALLFFRLFFFIFFFGLERRFIHLFPHFFPHFFPHAFLRRLRRLSGPPGTGKTRVAVAILEAWKNLEPNKKILAVADSNVAGAQMEEKESSRKGVKEKGTNIHA
eukprot:GHVT01065225.1.p1 GENE.GHVT01065225.1~~GHVT01065225.1.p1  ORF type:complete len:185 (+),score=35.57 GHVT01065225.1:416-970(+)